MNWVDYLSKVSEEENSIKGITLRFKGIETTIPELVRLSVLLLDKMVKCQGANNIFVFPEITETAFLFSITKLIYYILSGKIKGNYDPYLFTKGQKLKLGNSVVLFEGIVYGKDIRGRSNTIRADEPFLLVTTKDRVFNYLKLDCAPYFQNVDDSRSISTDKAFSKAKKKAGFSDDGEVGIINKLQQMKTHYDGTIFFVTSVDRAKKFIEETYLDGNSIKEIFFIATVKYTGELVNIVPGKLKGIPALTLTYQVDNILEAMEKGIPAQSVIVDLSVVNLESQMDALDELIERNIPIVCLTDTINSFDNSLLKERSFNYWRWNNNSLTQSLTNKKDLPSSRKSFNCYHNNIVFLSADSEDITKAFKLVSSHRNEIENLPTKCERLFRVLIRLAYKSIRSLELFENNYIESVSKELIDCEEVLNSERRHLSEGLYRDFSTAIELLKKIYSYGFEFPKISLLENYLSLNRPESIKIIVNNDSDNNIVSEQWKNRLFRHGYSPIIAVLHPNEYMHDIPDTSSLTIISGWFNKNTIRNILYSYNSDTYIVLLYENERTWKNHHIREWKRDLNDDCNQKAIERSFEPSRRDRKGKIIIETNRSEESLPTDTLPVDEQESIDLVLRQSIYSRYVSSGERRGRSDDIVTAYPVIFNGGYFSLITENHKSIVVTGIITGNSDRIDNVEVKGLKTGDLVTVRESSRDIIREVADSILKKSGMDDQRSISGKWKNALAIMNIFVDRDTIIDRLQDAGCNKNRQTIRNWMINENMIIPRSRRDLEIIAEVTKDKDLLERMDEVIAAGENVNRAHIKAGNYLSVLLKEKIAEVLSVGGDFDFHNTSEVIELQIDNIGLVKILKIIDIGSPISVSAMYTNKLMSEESEASTWL